MRTITALLILPPLLPAQTVEVFMLSHSINSASALESRGLLSSIIELQGLYWQLPAPITRRCAKNSDLIPASE